MKNPKASHPPGPTVPANLQTGDRVHLNGKNVEVYSGLCRLLFNNATGSLAFPLSISRNYAHEIYFQVDPNYTGEFSVVGEYAPNSPVNENDRSFGKTKITRSK